MQEEIDAWAEQLNGLSTALHATNSVQQLWTALSPLFQKGSRLPLRQLFTQADQQFRKLMAAIQSDARVVRLIEVPRIEATLGEMHDALVSCRTSLHRYIEEQRQQFPRFYFVGDHDLLLLLGQCTNPTQWRGEIRKIFHGVQSIEVSVALCQWHVHCVGV